MIFAEFFWKTSYHNKQVTKSHSVWFHKLLFLQLAPKLVRVSRLQRLSKAYFLIDTQ